MVKSLHPANVPTSGLLTQTETGIIKTLLYFDIFDYPLTITELIGYHPEKVEDDLSFQMVLDKLVADGLISCSGLFYGIQNSEELVVKRLEYNHRAAAYIQKAIRTTRIISRFPFVEMVALSGSLSKNAAGPDSDIDYFVIAKPGRVWVTRFLLTIYKKTILLNQSKYFCANLIMASDRLSFSDHSRYIATEIVSLLPLFGLEKYRKFLAQNSWTQTIFPNAVSRETEIVLADKKQGPVARVAEWVLDGWFGNNLDAWWQEVIRKKWHKDHAERRHVMQNPTDYIDIQPHIMKGHGGDQYPRIRQAFQTRIATFEHQFGIVIS